MASAKVDNNRGPGSFGSKRSRSDGAREGDWKCTKCGNVNFSFRAVCNRGTCGASRPSASPSPRMVPPAVGGGYEHRPSPYYGGAPPPLYGPPPPVGMSGSYGPAPYQHLSMRYGYGPPYGSSGSYPPYSSYHSPGPMGGIGYGPGADISRYGYGYRGSPMPGPSPWPVGAMPDNNDNNASRKRRGGPDGSPSEGDWKCPKCENVNFAFRTTCNMKKCGAPRPSYPASVNSNGGSAGKKEQGEAPEGSWTCSKCSNLNYPFRTVCNRKGCGNERPAPDTATN